MSNMQVPQVYPHTTYRSHIFLYATSWYTERNGKNVVDARRTTSLCDVYQNYQCSSIKDFVTRLVRVKCFPVCSSDFFQASRIPIHHHRLVFISACVCARSEFCAARNSIPTLDNCGASRRVSFCLSPARALVARPPRIPFLGHSLSRELFVAFFLSLFLCL